MGGVIGGIAALVIIGLLVYFCYFKRKRNTNVEDHQLDSSFVDEKRKRDDETNHQFNLKKEKDLVILPPNKKKKTLS